MRLLKRKVKDFINDETGQSTTEYILMLAVVVTIAVKFKSTIGDVMTSATDKIKAQIEGALEP